MKYAVALVAAAALARAQTRDDIPECALPCLDKAITDNSDCKTTDYACVCKNFDAIRGSATTCVIDECGPTVALNEVLPATEALCEAAGNGGGESSAPAASSSAAATSSAPAESTSVVETTSVEVITSSAAPTTVEVPTTVETSVAVPTNGTIPTTSAAPPAATTPGAPLPTGGAAALGSMGALAMLALGALAL